MAANGRAGKGDDGIAGCETCDCVADGGDDAGQFGAQHGAAQARDAAEGPPEEPNACREITGPEATVASRHRRCLDPDQHVVRNDPEQRQVPQRQNVGAFIAYRNPGLHL
jgi:hypothetical protein